MSNVTTDFRRRAALLVAVLVGGLAYAVPNAADAAVTVLGVQYQQDNPYSQYLCFWHDRNYPTSCGVDVVGANVSVFLRNDGTSSVTVSDVTLAGFSLKTVIRTKALGKHEPASVYFYWDFPPRMILDAGEPVWYRADPATIRPGGVARVVVRLRFVPVTPSVSVGVVTSAGTVSATIPVDAQSPQLASVGFSQDLTTVYLHWRRNGGTGAAPDTILMDGTDRTADATTVEDASVNFGASVLQLAEPLTAMSYHVFQGVYSDGKKAGGSLRAWVNPFIYGTWGARPTADGDYAAAQDWIDDATNRGVNALVNNMASGGLADYLATGAGRAYAADRGYGFVVEYPGQFGTSSPRMWFIHDEPDVAEGGMRCGTGLNLPCGEGHNSGALAKSLIAHGESLRASNPLSPTTINMDGGYKPYSFYNYGQVADVLMVDSYYQKRMVDSYWYYPQRIPLHRKATSIYATALAATTAAEPNPFHMILYSNQYKDPNSSNVWPFPTRESKRIEVYYALAGGAKGMAYWWFLAPSGLGAGTPAANALWKEIGLLGNEIKTASPLLVTSHPVAMTLQGSPGVWARALAVGVDTMMLMVVNDQYYNDQAGCHYTPISNASVTATLPAWLHAPTAFEITAGGLSNVGTLQNGSQLQVNLGTLNLTRMIVVTTNPDLRATLEARYQQEVAPGVCAFAPELCSHTPTITQQPASVTLPIGATAQFTVVATGSSLSYRWQKNGVNLSDGNGISGATSAALAISAVQASHAGGYRCVVTNSHGSVTSNTATLTVSAGATVIVDDQSAGFARFGPTAYWWQAAIGYLSHTYWTYVNGTTLSNYARWTPNLAAGGAGNYTVYVFIPRNYATAQQAKYRVRHNGRDDFSAPVNQSLYYDQWVSIGSYAFSATGGEYVELADATGEAYSTRRQIGFDAVKFVK